MSNLRNPHYDAWLHWVPTYQCNLDCDYCFLEKANRYIPKTKNINISAIKNTLNDSNKIYKITFSGGGEPFLTPNIVELCVELSKKHLLGFNTNLTSKKVKVFAEKINPERVMYITASCHIKALERMNLLSRYIDNFLFFKNRGFKIYATEVGYPPLLKEVDKYKKFFLEKGIELTFCPYIGPYKDKFYPDSYSENEVKIFGLTGCNFKQFYQYGKYCNVGYNIGLIKPNGDITYCYKINKSLGNIYKKIKFKNKLIKCPFKYCECPLNMYDLPLFRKAISEVSSYDLESIQLSKSIIKECVKNFLLNSLTEKKRNIIFKLFMGNMFTRNYILKYWL